MYQISKIGGWSCWRGCVERENPPIASGIANFGNQYGGHNGNQYGGSSGR